MNSSSRSPARARPEQLGLLLGIAQEAKLNVRAVIDSAVAAASSTELPRTMQAHRRAAARRGWLWTWPSSIARAGTVCGKSPKWALLQFAGKAGWMRSPTASSARRGSTPLRVAETEQQVFDPGVCAQVLKEGALELSVGVDHRGSERRIRLAVHGAGGQVRPTLRPLGAANRHRQLARADAPRPRASPVWRTRLRTLAATDWLFWTPRRSPGERHTGVRRHPSRRRRGCVHYVAAGEKAKRRRPKRYRPTHVLCDAMAVPLGDDFPAASPPPARMLSAASFASCAAPSGHYVVPAAEAELLLNEHTPLVADTRISLGDSIRCRGTGVHRHPSRGGTERWRKYSKRRNINVFSLFVSGRDVVRIRRHRCWCFLIINHEVDDEIKEVNRRDPAVGTAPAQLRNHDRSTPQPDRAGETA